MNEIRFHSVMIPFTVLWKKACETGSAKGPAILGPHCQLHASYSNWQLIVRYKLEEHVRSCLHGRGAADVFPLYFHVPDVSSSNGGTRCCEYTFRANLFGDRLSCSICRSSSRISSSNRWACVSIFVSKAEPPSEWTTETLLMVHEAM